MPNYCRQVDTALSGLSHAKEALNPSTSGWPEGNRPQGSLLVRTCACAEASPHCCAVHAVAPLLRKKSAGATLFDLTSSSFLKSVRRMLTLLGHGDANRCTLKAFRAGRATSLAAAGSPIGVILAEGEWKSSAFL